MVEVEDTGLGRREQRKLAAMERTLDAAARLFAEKGYDGTKVSEICAEAGIAYGTFFNHFSGKSDLLRGLTSRSEAGLAQRLEALAKQPGSIESQMRALFLETPDGSEAWDPSRRELQGLIWMTAATEGNAERDRNFHAAFRSFLEEGVARGRVRDDVSVETMAEIISSVIATMALNWVHDASYPLQERAEAAALFLADAITPRNPTHPAKSQVEE
jgi:AcrR family transcriptional regulator